jgi:hypothetical protein
MKSRFLPVFQQSNKYLFKGEVKMIPLSTVVWHYTFKAVISRFFLNIIITAFQHLRGVPLTTKRKGKLFPVLCLLFKIQLVFAYINSHRFTENKTEAAGGVTVESLRADDICTLYDTVWSRQVRRSAKLSRLSRFEMALRVAMPASFLDALAMGVKKKN